MVVREREYFRGKKVPLESWEIKLQEEFRFMEQDPESGEKDLYHQYGFDCARGWYGILHDCCQKIKERYAEAGMPVDFVPAQIKEKFGTLRFYYGFTDSPCKLAAFDFLGDGTSIRFDAGNDTEDEEKKKLRADIRQIVREAEERSRRTCEICGSENAVLRKGHWLRTLCDSCEDERIKRAEEAKKKHDDV